MRRFALAFGLFGSTLALAQMPPTEPKPLPPTVGAQKQQSEPTGTKTDAAVMLPQKENLSKLDPNAVMVRRFADSWQVWAGPLLFRDFGPRRDDADEMVKAVRELKATEWGMIGAPRPVVEYGLTNGKAAMTIGAPPKHVLPVDLASVKVDQVRGSWVVADDANILLNCGGNKLDAEQTVGVIKKYGYNRLGQVGQPATFSWLFAAPVVPGGEKPPMNAALTRAAQEQALTRSGVPVPGLGFVGERVVIDPRKVEVRKEKSDWVLAHGPDVLGHFGPSEWNARDAQKVVVEARFTEFCTVAGLSFFLVNGAAPTKVPFNAQGQRFLPGGLVARQLDGKWAVFEGSGRMLFPAASQSDADTIIRLVQGFQFDQLCQVGTSPRASLKFLAKTGGK